AGRGSRIRACWPRYSCRDRPDEAVERAHAVAEATLTDRRLAVGEELEHPGIEARIAREALDQRGDGRVRRETQVTTEPARGEGPVALEDADMVPGAGIERRDRVDEGIEPGRARIGLAHLTCRREGTLPREQEPGP